ncbi:hypothetical protein SKAU_G00126000 [Synaphobranchus kaupii]|uniref:Uncharacterized protein n=1 Tax=Synaphobranchus kaupii TaxID=118154 RepID=A0A9Q1J1W8_SYNKA|nr:hypothetical protein SKAU_G00126000 [Synaphobranchus kaupii]
MRTAFQRGCVERKRSPADRLLASLGTQPGSRSSHARKCFAYRRAAWARQRFTPSSLRAPVHQDVCHNSLVSQLPRSDINKQTPAVGPPNSTKHKLLPGSGTPAHLVQGVLETRQSGRSWDLMSAAGSTPHCRTWRSTERTDRNHGDDSASVANSKQTCSQLQTQLEKLNPHTDGTFTAPLGEMGNIVTANLQLLCPWNFRIQPLNAIRIRRFAGAPPEFSTSTMFSTWPNL